MRGGTAAPSMDGVTHLLLTFLAFDAALAVVLACVLGAVVVGQGAIRAVGGVLQRIHAVVGVGRLHEDRGILHAGLDVVVR